MKKSNPKGDDIIGPFRGDTHDKIHATGEGSLPPGGPAAKAKIPASGPPNSPAWTARFKRRWESMLVWLAKGAEHSCPT